MDVVRIRLLVLCFTLLLTLNSCGSSTTSASAKVPVTAAKCEPTAIANQYIVRWKNGSTGLYKNTTRRQLIDKVIQPHLDEVEFAEEDQQLSAPESRQVGLDLETQSVSTMANPPADWGQRITQASAAWNEGFTGQGVIVAVIDSGVERTHTQLKNQLYINPGESGVDSQGRNKATNGKDDDGNELIDDVSGYDFYANTGAVGDSSGHGTHVAGVIAAQHSAGLVKGIAENAKILSLDFMNGKSGAVSDAIRAMNYAAAQGAHVVNASWGGAPCSKNLQNTIADLGARGVIFVAAAGNDGVNLDVEPEYPAAFGMSSQVTVGASSTRDYMEMFSNFSSSLVNLVAPGDDIVSTYPGNTTMALSGTSMAAPFVSGALAVLISARPDASISELKAALYAGVDSGPFEVSSRGRLNIAKALAEIQKLPAPIPLQ